ncbi:MAG TPA: SusC/RagA family TonB-linked outer membrane protein, partial [Niastella sp.]
MRIPLLLFAMCIAGLATVNGQSNITSRIAGQLFNDQTGEPLGGASISINSVPAGALLGRGLSADDGTFSIMVKTADSVRITINYVGFAGRSMVTQVGQGIQIRLTPVSTELNSAVVIGYGKVKRKDLTGSVSQVQMGDLMKAPVRSFEEALGGRVAGVQVTSSDGQPGAETNIVIRGANSITQDNSPLYVIDGFPIENPNNNAINPQDIESIEVLKDASSTAIYGARGANGVILITTKKGKGSTATINFSTSYGFQQANKIVKLMSPAEFVKYQLEFNPSTVAYVPGSGTVPTPYQLYYSGGTTPEYYKDTAAFIDWQDMVLQTAPIQNHTLSVSGGNDKTKYLISTSLFNQDGIIINSGYKRYQGRIVLDQTVSKRLKVGINANYSYLLQSGLAPSQTNNSGTSNLMYSVWGYRPVAPSAASQLAIGVVDLSTSDFTDASVPSTQDYRFNPVVNLQNLVRDNRTKNLSVNGYAEYTIIPNLILRVTGGLTGNTLR